MGMTTTTALVLLFYAMILHAATATPKRRGNASNRRTRSTTGGAVRRVVSDESSAPPPPPLATAPAKASTRRVSTTASRKRRGTAFASASKQAKTDESSGSSSSPRAQRRPTRVRTPKKNLEDSRVKPKAPEDVPLPSIEREPETVKDQTQDSEAKGWISEAIKDRRPDIKRPTKRIDIPKEVLDQMAQKPLMSGSEGNIYRINYDGMDLVLKVPHDKPEVLDRTKKEAKILAGIDSKYIIHMRHHFKINDKIDGITLDFAPYGDGFDLLIKVRRVQHSIAEFELICKFAMRDLARSLLALHSHGHVHHDIKWENVLVFPDRLVLTDFGLAKVFERNHVSDNAYGSLRTMPPELITDRIYDNRGDMWGLAVMTFEFLVGNTPFETNPEDKYNTMRNICFKRDFLDDWEFSDTSKRFISRLAEKKTENRPDDMQIVLDDPWFADIRNVEFRKGFSLWEDFGQGAPYHKIRQTFARIHEMQGEA